MYWTGRFRYIVGMTQKGRYIVSKGNGLCFTRYRFVDTRELGIDIWGLLLEQDALRDYCVGLEVEKLGIKTNHMEYVLKLNYPLNLKDYDGHFLCPILLQYDLECPYRISDAAIMPKRVIQNEVSKWDKINIHKRKDSYLIAADVIIGNLRVLHCNNILHNAITTHNYTWALELLDFELASSPYYPYSSKDSERHKSELYNREIIHCYQIITTIASILGEHADYEAIEDIFDQNGFDISVFAVTNYKIK